MQSNPAYIPSDRAWALSVRFKAALAATALASCLAAGPGFAQDLAASGPQVGEVAADASAATELAADNDVAPDDGDLGVIEAPEGAAMLSGSDAAAMSLMDEGVVGDADAGLAGILSGDAAAAPRRASPEGWGAAALLGNGAKAGAAGGTPSGPLDEPDTDPLNADPLNANPVVIELFTAQGCSSCPPADRLLADLSGRVDVLPLSWHVDYWDYLGWTDEFALPQNTERQEGYARAVGEQGVYTPQMIVGGQDTLLSVRPAELMALIGDHQGRPAEVMVTATRDGARHVIQLTPRAAIPGGVRVVLVRYAPRREVTVRAGENRGRTVVYANVVLGTQELTRWDAHAPLRLTVSPGGGKAGDMPADTLHAIIAQQALPGKGDLPGPILAAVRLD